MGSVVPRTKQPRRRQCDDTKRCVPASTRWWAVHWAHVRQNTTKIVGFPAQSGVLLHPIEPAHAHTSPYRNPHLAIPPIQNGLVIFHRLSPPLSTSSPRFTAIRRTRCTITQYTHAHRSMMHRGRELGEATYFHVFPSELGRRDLLLLTHHELLQVQRDALPRPVCVRHTDIR